MKLSWFCLMFAYRYASQTITHMSHVQVISPLFADHIEPYFEISQDPFTKHRALNLANVSTSLSGLYSCRVASNSGDSFQSKELTIFCEL